jgi:flagellar basal body-associated protein FliL
VNFLCFVFTVPPRKLTILYENGTNVQQKRVIGPYTEGSTAQITCFAAGGEYTFFVQITLAYKNPDRIILDQLEQVA